MKSRTALLASALVGGLAMEGRCEAVPEMVGIEARFYEVTAGPLPALPSQADPGRDAGTGKTADRTEAPALLTVAGVLTAGQAEAWTKILLAGGARLLDRQKIAVLSGHRARMQNARALRYPSDFESSRTPEAEGVYPIAFEARDVGFLWEVEPRIGSDGQTIDLSFSPRVVEFQGFIDAARISGNTSREQIREMLKTPPKTGAAWQPVFHSREVTTEVSVRHGHTVVLHSPPAADTPGTVILLTVRILPPL